jgi:DNA helicase-2/ATP-dependent DNA helicase PcrA
MDFSKRYKALNSAQREAVDTIEGPVMVVAGPGTGKTELLSVRTANILAKTDTLPENILCLTFTESGAAAMRERLTTIIGKDAYKVAIHTFHSFGSEVINQNGEFFYQGANFRPADDLSTYEVLRGIFEQLEYGNPIASKMNDEYTYLRDTVSVISELKQSGLTSSELLRVLSANDAVIEKAEQVLIPIFTEKINKTTAEKTLAQVDTIRSSGQDIEIPGLISLSTVMADSLETAANQAISDNSTKPMTAWKNQWFKKDTKGAPILKSHEKQIKLRALSTVYDQYMSRMQEGELYDFDDMIMNVVHTMEVIDDLRFNLQEKYQYIMVDEFQDTNLAQMRIIHNLTNNEVQGDTPNIMVVGDDDQAIYSFQGADISNILNFVTMYPRTKRVTLTENYRSTEEILKSSREVILQGGDRLENKFPSMDKNLKANVVDSATIVSLYEAETIIDERQWVVDMIAERIKDGENAGDIAVLTRRHNEIAALLPYFAAKGIAVNYERQDNVLELLPIILLEKIARLFLALSDGEHDVVNGLLPEILAHPVWRIPPSSLWRLSIKAYERHVTWLEAMATSPEFVPLHGWLITTMTIVKHAPLEQILDTLVGKPITAINDDEVSEQLDPFVEPMIISDFVSPLFNFFFSDAILKNRPDEYLTYLEALRTIRTKLREYRPTEVPTLATFIEFITLHRQLGSKITSIRLPSTSADAVNVMTAHKSKGLEFTSVFIMNGVDSSWGEKARSKSRLIGYPENLQIARNGDNSDERLRLFYVSMTRAKRQLYISYSLSDDAGKRTLRADFLLGDSWSAETIKHDISNEVRIENAELAWYQPLIPKRSTSLKDLLVPTLAQYKLSSTHLHNFLDVTNGGPGTFLLHNLLRFPEAMSPYAAYGSAIHSALQRAHVHLTAHGERQAVEDVIHNFESALDDRHLLESDFEKFTQKGSESIQAFLAEKYSTFKPGQKTELNFSGQQSIVGDAHLTGSLDLVDIKPNKTIAVTDYKTGNPSNSWTGKTDYEKIKLHKYKQQLLFYKLLVEHSRDYRAYTFEQGILQFVEPTKSGEILSLEALFDKNDLDRFKKLIVAVWKRIITLDLPDTSGYEQSLKGILAFEQDLLDNTI